MSREELLLAQRALQQRGYRYFYAYGMDPSSWCLRARRYPMASAEGRNERVIEFCDIADMPQSLRPTQA